MAQKEPASMNDFDKAAIEAQNDLANVDPVHVEAVAAWWKKWYLTAGHKRLGRILVKE